MITYAFNPIKPLAVGWRCSPAVLLAAGGLAAGCAGCAASAPWVPAGTPASLHVPAHGDEAYTVTATDASARVSRTCTLPCDLNIASGTTAFTFRRDDGAVVGARVVVPPARSEVTFHRMHRPLFVAGGVLSIAGILLGLPLAIETAGGPEQSGGVDSTSLTLGGVGLGALAVGIILMVASGSDGADVRPTTTGAGPMGVSF